MDVSAGERKMCLYGLRVCADVLKYIYAWYVHAYVIWVYLCTLHVCVSVDVHGCVYSICV